MTDDDCTGPYAKLPEMTESDRLIGGLFEERGFRAKPVIWSDPTVRWWDYDLVMIRSAWDSHIDPPAFDRWLDHLAELGVQTLNPLHGQPLGFHGKAYFYVSGITSSAASTCAANANSHHLATIVGQETAGRYAGGGSTDGLNLVP